jgi:HPt (histidine-containing phosphotransfer) domain-containing protein
MTTNGSSRNDEAACGELADDLSEVCDRATLDELWAEGDSLLPALVGIFQTEVTKGLDELTRALAARDCAAVARIAHTLKGNAGIFGAIHMREMAANIDQAARAGHDDQATVMLGEFRSECERVRSYLDAELKTRQLGE